MDKSLDAYDINNILQVNTHDIHGGAAKGAYELYKRLNNKGFTTNFAVGYKGLIDDKIIPIPNEKEHTGISKWMLEITKKFEKENWRVGKWQVSGLPRRIANLDHILIRCLGYEDYHFPGTKKLLNLFPGKVDILHLHNLHGEYFDLRYLPVLSKTVPTVLTLHDAWLLSGHCAHSFDCERWKTGCGQCPDLTIYPAIRRDNTARNWKIKKEIFTKSQLYIATPSDWLMQKVKESSLGFGTRMFRVIPNGVDQNIFTPSNSERVRLDLGIPQDRIVLAFVANFMKDDLFKDYETLKRIVYKLSLLELSKPISLIALGSSGDIEQFGNTEIRHFPFRKDPIEVAKIYQSADVYIHMARAENYPYAIIEALSCGIPVIATKVGGISEQIIEGKNGFLTPVGDDELVIARIIELLNNKSLYTLMSGYSVQDAHVRFNIEDSIMDYCKFYSDSFQDFHAQNRTIYHS